MIRIGTQHHRPPGFGRGSLVAPIQTLESLIFSHNIGAESLSSTNAHDDITLPMLCLPSDLSCSRQHSCMAALGRFAQSPGRNPAIAYPPPVDGA
ncbi:hypothetical protein IF2G_01043 [Cordyceps javanica]|nr:hypothetical protein IF2G_01043 [Cordyceps javanica]